MFAMLNVPLVEYFLLILDRSDMDGPPFVVFSTKNKCVLQENEKVAGGESEKCNKRK